MIEAVQLRILVWRRSAVRDIPARIGETRDRGEGIRYSGSPRLQTYNCSHLKTQTPEAVLSILSDRHVPFLRCVLSDLSVRKSIIIEALQQEILSRKLLLKMIGGESARLPFCASKGRGESLNFRNKVKHVAVIQGCQGCKRLDECWSVPQLAG